LFVVHHLEANCKFLTYLLAATACVVVSAVIDGEYNLENIHAYGQILQNYQFKCRK